MAELRRLLSGLLVIAALRLWPARRDSDGPVLLAFQELGQALEEEARASWEAGRGG